MSEERRETPAAEERGDTLDRRELDTLLSFLGRERESAGREYERIRHRLIRFLEWRGCTEADQLADEAMNRVARRLAEGLEIESDDPYVYFRGVAKMILSEWRRERRRDRDAQRGASFESERLRPSVFDDEQDTDPETSEQVRERLQVLHECLALLPEHERDLVLRFYQGEGAERIRQRRRLARERAITMTALRLRAFRIRRRLERYMDERLEQEE